jgi:hypothetical protein
LGLTEVDNVDVTTSVVLDHLVGSLVGTATDDVGSSTTLKRDSILANILEPDELKVTGAETVDTLLLVGADDDVSKSGAVLKNKDCILLTCRMLVSRGLSNRAGKRETYRLRSDRST